MRIKEKYFAVVNKAISPIFSKPSEGVVIDEVLYGMTVGVIEELQDFTKVETEYRYSGFVRNSDIIKGSEYLYAAGMVKHRVRHYSCDIMSEPTYQSIMLATLTKGSVLYSDPDADPRKESQWVNVRLADGAKGYVRAGLISPEPREASSFSESVLRSRVVASAKEYMYSPYRWGGKSPLGIDCSGLVSMAYMLNGYCIYRDAKIVEGFPVKEISFEMIRESDLLFFPGHVGMYIGDNSFIHSSSHNGGVFINSFDKESENYNPLWHCASYAGSVF